MKSTMRVLLAGTALCAVGVSGAYAQSSDLRPVGARVGAFTVFPQVKAEMSYTDNLFAESTGEVSDFGWTVSPSVLARSNFSRHEVVAQAAVVPTFYSDNSDDNFIDYNAGINGRIDVSRGVEILPVLSYRHGHEPRGDDNVGGAAAEPVESNIYNVGADIRYNPSRLRLEFGGSVRASDFIDNALLAGGTDNQDDRDRVNYGVRGLAGYEIGAKTYAFVRGSYNRVDFSNNDDIFGVKRDSNIYNVGAGLSYEPSVSTVARASIGYISQSFDNAVFGDVSGIGANLQLNWRLSPLTELIANGERRVDQTTQGTAASELVWAAQAEVRHDLRRNLQLSGLIGYSNRLFEGGTSTREDDVYRASVGADYTITRNFVLGAKYTYATRVSSDTGFGYQQSTVLASVTARF